VETVRITALRAIYDQLHFYGLQAFNIDENHSSEAGGGGEGDGRDKEPTGSEEGQDVESEEEGEKEDGKSEESVDNFGKGIMGILTDHLDNDVSMIK